MKGERRRQLNKKIKSIDIPQGVSLGRGYFSIPKMKQLLYIRLYICRYNMAIAEKRTKKMNTTIMTVEELFKNSDYKKGFDIPYYQRGYRWKSENIEELIQDISKEDKGYCLQPIVINKNSNGGLPQIVDGQQRLTTISLIRKELKCDDDKIYSSLRCNKRNKIDEYFLVSAENTIRKVLSENKKDEGGFCDKLKECLFIVCSIDANDKGAEEVFLRLNIGKIPLSSAEIFKAYCLTEKESGCNDNNFIGIWNDIESALQDDSFYYFFSHDEKRNVRYYSTRMDFLLEVFVLIHCTNISLEIIKNEYEKNPNYIFKKLKERIGDNNSPGTFIKELKEIFDRFQQVYSDIRLYNLFGYLSCCPKHEDMLYLCKSIADVSTEPTVLDCLNRLVNKSVNCNGISEMKYGENNNEDIKKILLLHNALKSLEYDFWFNYNSYRNTGYDLEHIHARAELKSKEDVKTFLKDIENFKREFEGAEYKDFFKDFEDFCSEYDMKDQDKLETFEKCILALQSGGKVKKEGDLWIPQLPPDQMQEDADEWIQTSIMNLCLLPASINRSISNNGFTEKRKQVTKLIHTSGEEIPIATALIFDLQDENPYGTRDAGVWSKTMGEKYLKDIEETISRGVFRHDM